MGCRCLPLLARVGAVHTPIRVGCILTRQSWDTSHHWWKHGASACGIRSPAKNPHPKLPAALRGLGRAARFGTGPCLPVLPRLGRGKPAFPVPRALRFWGSSGGSQEARPLCRGCSSHQHAKIPTWSSGVLEERWGSKKWTLQGVCSRSCAGCPSMEASLWSQSCPSSKDAGGWFEVRAPQTHLGLWHPSANPQIWQDTSPWPASLEQGSIATALGSAPGEHSPPTTAWLWLPRWGRCLPGPQQSTNASSWVKGCTDVPHSPLWLHPVQALHVSWWMQK